MSGSPGGAGRRGRRALPALIVLGLFLAGFPALRSYNVTWDEALGDLFFGQRYLSFFTSFDPEYLDVTAEPYPAGHRPDLSSSPFRIKPWEYYPAANILAAAVSSLLSGRLGLLDPFDGFHAVNLLLAAWLVLALFRAVGPRHGDGAAAVAALLLLLSPRIACDLFANIKDFPEMVFFSVTLFALLRALERGSVRGLVASGLLWGLALATKANALFLPFIPIIVLAAGGIPAAWSSRRARLAGGLLLAAAAGAIVLVALWPYLWQDPIGRLVQNLRYVAHQKFQTRAESVAAPIPMILLTTPIPFLLLFAAGLVPAFRSALRRDRFAILLLAWIGVVLGRLLLPNAVNFDGVRHFLEIFPPMAVVAGLGARGIADAAAARLRSPRGAAAVRIALLALPVAMQGAILARAHPLEIGYFNAFTGGLAGARARGVPQAGDYWGMSYRLGLSWLDANAPPNSVLVVPIVEHAVRLVAPERLRKDIALFPLTQPVSPQIDPARLALLDRVARERPVFVMFVLRDDWENGLMKECRARLTPVAEWRTGGAPVLQIYRYPG